MTNNCVFVTSAVYIALRPHLSKRARAKLLRELRKMDAGETMFSRTGVTLDSAFWWNGTPQGDDYWRALAGTALHDNWQAFERLLFAQEVRNG